MFIVPGDCLMIVFSLQYIFLWFVTKLYSIHTFSSGCYKTVNTKYLQVIHIYTKLILTYYTIKTCMIFLTYIQASFCYFIKQKKHLKSIMLWLLEAIFSYIEPLNRLLYKREVNLLNKGVCFIICKNQNLFETQI